MKYLAVLGYDCGCEYESNYAFMMSISFNADSKGDLEKRLSSLRERISRSDDGFQCHRQPPVEILLFDNNLRLVRKISGEEK